MLHYAKRSQTLFGRWRYRIRPSPTGPVLQGEERYVAPKGYSDHYHHLKNWIDAIRSREPVIEDPVYGFRAAGTALLSNVSYDSGKPAHWDPEGMRLL